MSAIDEKVKNAGEVFPVSVTIPGEGPKVVQAKQVVIMVLDAEGNFDVKIFASDLFLYRCLSYLHSKIGW